MRFRQVLLKWGVVFLVILLVQKTGGSLFLHNIFHNSGVKEYPLNDDKGKEISYACSCVDDFLAPFEESGTIELDTPRLAHVAYFINDGEGISAKAVLLASLRGPPAQLN